MTHDDKLRKGMVNLDRDTIADALRMMVVDDDEMTAAELIVGHLTFQYDSGYDDGQHDMTFGEQYRD